MGGSMAWKREEEKQYKRKNFERRFILPKNHKRVIFSKNQKNGRNARIHTRDILCGDWKQWKWYANMINLQIGVKFILG